MYEQLGAFTHAVATTQSPRTHGKLTARFPTVIHTANIIVALGQLTFNRALYLSYSVRLTPGFVSCLFTQV